MANVKNAAIREIVIDHCLRHPGGRTVQQIILGYNAKYDALTTSEYIISIFVRE